MPAILVPCYDTYLSTVTVAQGLMETHGLVSSFFVDFNTLDANYTHPTTDQVVNFQSSGHEIGIYSGVYPDGSPNGCNFLQLSQKPNGLRLAHDWLLAIKATAASKGFNPASLAPYQRAWSQQLRNIAPGIFENVRASDDSGVWQTQPVPDRLYVKKGGTPSLSHVDTAASICAQIESVCVSGGIYFMIIHQVGVDSDPNYSVRTADLDAGFAYARTQINAGRLRNMTFADAVRAS